MCWLCWAAFASQPPTFVEHSKPRRPQHPHAGAVSSMPGQRKPCTEGAGASDAEKVSGVNHARAI
jgi:hypothetical protein